MKANEIQEMRAYSPEYTAKVIGVHVNTVRALIREGKLPAVRLGRKYLIGVSQLEKFLDGSLPKNQTK